MFVVLIVVLAAVVLVASQRRRPNAKTLLLVALPVLVILFLVVGRGGGGDVVEEEDPVVYFTQPLDGTTVVSPVSVAAGVEHLRLEPAGAVVEGAGHLHVMVDAPCLDAGQPIPRDATHVHLGDGSTTTTLTLAPGEHRLCLQAGNGAHLALAATDTVTVNVRP